MQGQGRAHRVGSGVTTLLTSGLEKQLAGSEHARGLRAALKTCMCTAPKEGCMYHQQAPIVSHNIGHVAVFLVPAGDVWQFAAKLLHDRCELHWAAPSHLACAAMGRHVAHMKLHALQ